MTPNPTAQILPFRPAQKRKQPKRRNPPRLVGSELLKKREEVELRNRQAL